MAAKRGGSSEGKADEPPTPPLLARLVSLPKIKRKYATHLLKRENAQLGILNISDPISNEYEKMKGQSLQEISVILDDSILTSEIRLVAAILCASQHFQSLLHLESTTLQDLEPGDDKWLLLRAVCRVCVTVTECLALYPNSVEVQLAAFTCIAEALWCELAHPLFGYGTYRAILRAFQNHLKEPRVHVAACYCVAVLCEVADIAKYLMGQLGLPQILLESLKEHGPSNPKLAVAGVWAIHSLCHCEQLRQHFSDPGLNTAGILLDIRASNRGDEDVNMHVMICIAVLTINSDQTAASWGDAGAVAAVFETMITFPEKEKVILAALWAMRNLCAKVHSNREAFLRRGMAQTLIDVLIARQNGQFRRRSTFHKIVGAVGSSLRTAEKPSSGNEPHRDSWDMVILVERVAGSVLALTRDNPSAAEQLLVLGMQAVLVEASQDVRCKKVRHVCSRVIQQLLEQGGKHLTQQKKQGRLPTIPGSTRSLGHMESGLRDDNNQELLIRPHVSTLTALIARAWPFRK